MRKLMIPLLVLVFAAFSYGTSYAVLLTDVTEFTESGTIESKDFIGHGWGKVNFLNDAGDYVTWAHNYEFVPPAAEILTGELTIYLRDDERDTLNPFTWEFGGGIAEDGSWDIGAINTGSYRYNLDVDYLADGRFVVKVGSLFGDFYIESSKLEITYNAVPEPSVLLLLGAGLIGLAVFRKRLKRA